MSPDELRKLKEFIIREMAPKAKAILDTTSLFSTRLVSSRNLIYLIGFLEDQYKLKITPADMTLENLDSIQAIDRFVTRKRNRLGHKAA